MFKDTGDARASFGVGDLRYIAGGRWRHTTTTDNQRQSLTIEEGADEGAGAEVDSDSASARKRRLKLQQGCRCRCLCFCLLPWLQRMTELMEAGLGVGCARAQKGADRPDQTRPGTAHDGRTGRARDRNRAKYDKVTALLADERLYAVRALLRDQSVPSRLWRVWLH